MTLEEVLSDADSKMEDEDFKDEQERIKLDRLDVSDEEKRFMWLWNTYVRRKSEFADEHVPLACEEFVKLHAKELILPKFICQWIAFTITLWNYGLICSKTMDKCSIILQNTREEEEEAAAAAKEGTRKSKKKHPTLKLMLMATIVIVCHRIITGLLYRWFIYVFGLLV
ncbi:unnamed protein product [Eruca vesicaria subsp. sativa]|uniref:Polycomb protein VEFS-Box domain-containing protein n=1 Tax=Eruca vesicaria subsp. sativa TaxID=29727 RepID=A0ABC8KKC6_ERUVS|nr:unnamed protein product [Eruca vesicaria subsp. sativa]